MKAKKELNNSKERVEAMNKKHLELAEDELGLVSGGVELYLQGDSSSSVIALNDNKKNTDDVLLNGSKNTCDNIVLQGGVQNPVLVDSTTIHNGDTSESADLYAVRRFGY